MAGDFMPKREADLLVWFADYAAGIGVHGTTVGLTAAEKTQVLADRDMVALVVNGQQVLKTDAEEWTAFKGLVLYGGVNTPLPATPTPGALGVAPVGALAAIVPRNRQLIERVKPHPNFTQAIGEDLGVIGADEVAVTPKPELQGNALTGFGVELRFPMMGHDSIGIYSKRGSEAEWTLITVDTNSPYTDGRAPLVANQPESRQYRAQYRDDDQPVGDWSDVITITAQA